jgi:N-acetylmuramoyl-L-alanine amidase
LKTIFIHNRQKSNHLTIKLITDKLLYIAVFIFLILALLGLSSTTVHAASSLKLYDYATKKTTSYTGKQVKVTYNGVTITKSTVPGILEAGVALVPYDDVFMNSSLAAKCVYDSKKGSISIAKYGTTIVMTIGSKKATVNGKAVTLTVAPKRIKYAGASVTKVLVPSRFISETLGLSYEWNSAASTVSINKAGLTLAYEDYVKFEYTGAQTKVTYNGKNISLGKMPGIILNNTNMVSAKTVFASSNLGATYKYDSKKKTITLTKNDKVLVMTLGSTKAFLNKKEVKLDNAPLLVKNYEADTTYVLVPAKSTSTYLGFQYVWNNALRTAIITGTSKDSGKDQTTNEPELGDDGVINETGSVLKEWSVKEALYGKSSAVYDLKGAATTGNGAIYSVSRDYSDPKLNAETFVIAATSAYGNISSSSQGNLITIQASNVTCTDQSYLMNGQFSNSINTINTLNSTPAGSTIIQLDVLKSNYQYDIRMSEDKLILYVTIYTNAVVKANVGVNSDGDYITLTGVKTLKPEISEKNGLLSINLPGTSNLLGDINTEITGAKFITKIATVINAEDLQIVLSVKAGYEYYILEKENQYTLSLRSKTTHEDTEDDDPEDTNDTTDSATPAVIPTVKDPSKYEITIPMPEKTTKLSITHEDFYMNNYFVIRIAGNYADFFKNSNFQYSSSVIKKISVSKATKELTEIKIETTKLQGYELGCDSKNLYINIGDPRDIYKNIVLLDPGHGGDAAGAKYFNTNEKDVNFKILYTIGKNYFNQDTTKLKVYYTRVGDNDLKLSERAALSQAVGADIFVSLHMNATGDASVSGTEVFYSKSNNTANKAGLTSQKLASMFLSSITQSLGTKNRTVKAENFTVIYKNTVPAVLIELGFLSNKQEHFNLTNQQYQEKAAKTIYQTLLQVFEAYPTGR